MRTLFSRLHLTADQGELVVAGPQPHVQMCFLLFFLPFLHTTYIIRPIIKEQMGVSENSVSLHPMVNDHYPYSMAISLGILTQHFQTNPNLSEKSRRTMRITTTTSELHSTGQPGSPPAGMIPAFEHQHQLKQIYIIYSLVREIAIFTNNFYAENMLKICWKDAEKKNLEVWKAMVLTDLAPVMPPTPCWICWSTLTNTELTSLSCPRQLLSQLKRYGANLPRERNAWSSCSFLFT